MFASVKLCGLSLSHPTLVVLSNFKPFRGCIPEKSNDPDLLWGPILILSRFELESADVVLEMAVCSMEPLEALLL